LVTGRRAAQIDKLKVRFGLAHVMLASDHG
jgi:hypothetical protein